LQYRFDIQFGTTLRNIQTNEFRTYYPSANTSFYYGETLPLINQDELVTKLIDELDESNIIEKTKRENSQWTIDKLYEYVLLVVPIPGIFIGSKISLPEYIKNSKSIVGFENVDNNLCFWYCLAYHKNPGTRIDRLSLKVKSLFKQYYQSYPTNDYNGVELDELDGIEEHFQVKINVYSWNNKVIDMERHSSKLLTSIINLNLYSESQTQRYHFSYITNLNNLTRVFRCPNCNVLLSEFKKLTRHYESCNNGEPKISFVDGIYNTPKTVFEQLDDVGINIPSEDRFYPYFIFYDFETWLKPNEMADLKASKLEYLGTHELMSISLLGSEESVPVFIAVDTTTESALQDMVNKMDELRNRYIHKLSLKYNQYFKQIHQLEERKERINLMRKLLDWLESMPVYGFNSSAYDLNVVKKHLPNILIKNAGKKYGNISMAEKKWIYTVEEGLGYKIEPNYRIKNYVVDGFDRQTNTVYEFNGCYWHGCPECYKEDELTQYHQWKRNENSLRKAFDEGKRPNANGI
jgi:hypothetical protein